MNEEYDRKLMPDILQTTFAISLGAAYKSLNLVKNPPEGMATVISEVSRLLTVPPDAGKGFQEKAQAVADAWLDRGMELMQECKTAGETFTEGK